MYPSRVFRFVIAFTLLLTVLSPVAWAQDLKYGFKKGEDPIWHVEFRSEWPGQVNITQNYLQMRVKLINPAKDHITLNPIWHTTARTTQKNNTSFTTGGGPPSILLKDPPKHMLHTQDVIIDRTGKIIRADDPGFQLDGALGSAYLLALQPLPPKDKKTWQTKRPMTLSHIVTEQKPAFGPPGAPGRPGNSTRTDLKCEETITYTLGEAANGYIAVTRHSEIISEEKVGDKPKQQIIGDGEYIFDPKSGLIESLEFTLVSENNSDNMSVKIPIRCTMRRIYGEELQKLTEEANAADAKRKVDEAKAAEARKNDLREVPAGYMKLDAVGFERGQEFYKMAPDRKPLIGFKLTNGNWMGQHRFPVLEPLFEKPKDPAAEGETIVLAKDGYAVGSIEVNSPEAICWMTITFMKMNGGVLDPKDSYTSDEYGKAADDTRKTISSNGKIVYGAWGRRGFNVDALGFIVKGTAPAPAKKK